MESKDGDSISYDESVQRKKERLEAIETLQGFLKEEGVLVNNQVECLEVGLQVLFEGLASLGEDPADEDEVDDPTKFVTEIYERRRAQQIQQTSSVDDSKPQLLRPRSITLSLASGRHSLWGHKLWNASRYLSDIFDSKPSLVRGKNVLELGAGAGCPSLIAALNGAQRVIISDYANSQDTVLVEAIRQNIDRLCPAFVPQNVMHAVGYIWGKDIKSLIAPLQGAKSFDVIICADLIFNRSEHDKLLQTIFQCLSHQGGVAFIAYSHHDPKKADQDMNFFTLAKEAPYQFKVEDVDQVQMRDLFVENDGLDDERGMVYLKKLSRST